MLHAITCAEEDSWRQMHALLDTEIAEHGRKEISMFSGLASGTHSLAP